jgi:hypothetical protein
MKRYKVYLKEGREVMITASGFTKPDVVNGVEFAFLLDDGKPDDDTYFDFKEIAAIIVWDDGTKQP